MSNRATTHHTTARHRGKAAARSRSARLSYGIERLSGAVLAVEQFILGLAAAALALLISAQVVLRYGLGAPLFWAEDVAIQLLIYMTLFGLSALLARGELIKVDFLQAALPPRPRLWLITVIDVAVLAIIALLGYYAYAWLLDPITRAAVSPTTGLPKWYFYAALPIALTTMGLHQIDNLVSRDKQAVEE